MQDALLHLQGTAVLGATFKLSPDPRGWHNQLSTRMVPFLPRLDHTCWHQSQRCPEPA